MVVNHSVFPVALLIAAALLSAPAGYGAAAGDDPVAEPWPKVIMVVPADQLEAVIPIHAAIEGQLSDLDVDLVTVEVERLADGLRSQVEVAGRVASGAGAMTVFWCDLSDPARGFLYLSEAAGERMLLRTLTGEDDGGRAEAVAIIVRTSVMEMMRGGIIGVGVESLLPASTEQPSQGGGASGTADAPVKPRDGPARRLFGTLSYALYMHSRDHLAVHGANLALGYRADSRWALVLGYTVLGALEEEDRELITVRLNRHPFTLGARALLVTGPLELSADLSVLLDYVTFEDSALAPGMRSVSDREDFAVGMMATLLLGIPITERLEGFVAAGVEVSILTHHYIVDGPEGRRVVLDSWPAQPWLLVGFLLEIL